MKNLTSAEKTEERDSRKMTTDPWIEYELAKAKLRKMELSYAEYEAKLREIADRLGI